MSRLQAVLRAGEAYRRRRVPVAGTLPCAGKDFTASDEYPIDERERHRDDPGVYSWHDDPYTPASTRQAHARFVAMGPDDDDALDPYTLEWLGGPFGADSAWNAAIFTVDDAGRKVPAPIPPQWRAGDARGIIRLSPRCRSSTDPRQELYMHKASLLVALAKQRGYGTWSAGTYPAAYLNPLAAGRATILPPPNEWNAAEVREMQWILEHFLREAGAFYVNPWGSNPTGALYDGAADAADPQRNPFPNGDRPDPDADVNTYPLGALSESEEDSDDDDDSDSDSGWGWRLYRDDADSRIQDAGHLKDILNRQRVEHYPLLSLVRADPERPSEYRLKALMRVLAHQLPALSYYKRAALAKLASIEDWTREESHRIWLTDALQEIVRCLDQSNDPLNTEDEPLEVREAFAEINSDDDGSDVATNAARLLSQLDFSDSMLRWRAMQEGAGDKLMELLRDPGDSQAETMRHVYALQAIEKLIDGELVDEPDRWIAPGLDVVARLDGGAGDIDALLSTHHADEVLAKLARVRELHDLRQRRYDARAEALRRAQEAARETAQAPAQFAPPYNNSE